MSVRSINVYSWCVIMSSSKVLLLCRGHMEKKAGNNVPFEWFFQMKTCALGHIQENSSLMSRFLRKMGHRAWIFIHMSPRRCR